MTAQLSFRRADTGDVDVLVALYDGAARWMIEQGIDQWKPGQKDADHFRLRIKEGEVWLALGDDSVAGAYELWWDDEPAWGVQPPVAGYVHRLMVRRGAPAGTGGALLAHAERRIVDAGRSHCRLDCVSSNPRLRAYYEGHGYAVVGEQPFKSGGAGSSYAVTLLEKRLGARG
ncbi:GNAT family N-acetyltransferase [Streptomyces sp. VRA16 Mangrove soil]|uniref:GNAT family N-acetyltransferase n=1 Tax=Streptomyces sp. VRA16 Mangrove soil TaxID=2817434 RepID=UPI001A9E27BE|nr:GNAT family N-acetyltransferase [Streptomyces sp. VRA16 Mangrove soil]MBO1333262.1 GNAT family N-acetyltransferase [Streptomyces sp. VRA16 Mangrove soil]